VGGLSLAFYKTALARDVSDLAWDQASRSGRADVCAGAAISDGNLAGFSPTICFQSLDLGLPTDIAIWKICLSPKTAAGGGGWDGALIEAVYEKAQAANASRVYWLTQSSNNAGAGRSTTRLPTISDFIQLPPRCF